MTSGWRRWLRRVAVSSCLAVGLVAATIPSMVANAASSEDGPARAAIDLQRTAQEFRAVGGELRDAEVAVSTTQASLNVTDGELQLNRAQLADVTDRIRERGVVAYKRSGSSTVAPLDVQHATDLDTAERYVAVASEVDTRDLELLQRVEAKLQHERADKAADHDSWVAKRDDDRRRYAELSETRTKAQAALDHAGAVPVMGDAVLRPSQLAAWYRSTGAVPRLEPGTTIDDIAALYIQEGAAEGVRGDLAFAQAIIETGSFAVAAGNNYSGIGVCDSCRGGYAFPTPRDGVRAQMQLLRNYADPDSTAARLANAASPTLYGADSQKAVRLYDTFFLKGKAPLWNLMGGGNWATDPTYAGKVVGLFDQMVLFADAHPEVS